MIGSPPRGVDPDRPGTNQWQLIQCGVLPITIDFPSAFDGPKRRTEHEVGMKALPGRSGIALTLLHLE
jgi:hypothetical protein